MKHSQAAFPSIQFLVNVIPQEHLEGHELKRMKWWNERMTN